MACQAAHLAQHIASVTRVPRTHRRSALAAGLNAALTGALARSVVTAARKGGAADNLGWAAPEHRDELKKLVELADRAASRWEPTLTGFLSPALAAHAMAALAGRSDVQAVPFGGFAQAERCRLILGPEEVMGGVKEQPAESGAVAALSVTGNFLFDAADHRDFLGAILGTGVVREKVGDILVQGERGAQVLVDPELVDHFETSLTQVRTVPVQTKAIPLQELNAPIPRVEEITSIEASLRVDALASAGFRMSRSKMKDLVEGGDVRLNWRAVTKTSVELKEGDMVSVRGKGRLEIKGIMLTKKERYAVTMMRYM